MCALFNRDSLSHRKAEKGVWEIEITRPLCGIQRDGNRKSQGALARLCEFPGRIPLRRVWAAAQRTPDSPREAIKNKNQGAKRHLIPPSSNAASSRYTTRNPVFSFLSVGYLCSFQRRNAGNDRGFAPNPISASRRQIDSY